MWNGSALGISSVIDFGYANQLNICYCCDKQGLDFILEYFSYSEKDDDDHERVYELVNSIKNVFNMDKHRWIIEKFKDNRDKYVSDDNVIDLTLLDEIVLLTIAYGMDVMMVHVFNGLMYRSDLLYGD